MKIPYRTRRVLGRVGTVLTFLLVLTVVVWLCWVVWLQRYVVYSDEGAKLDFEYSSYGIVGERAVPPVAEQKISIFYNEGADAIDTVNELTQLSGYYITTEMFQQDIEFVQTAIERLPAGTAVMIDMKGPFGSFYYQSNLSDAVISQSTNIQQVTALVNRLKAKGFYTIARVSAFRDRSFGETHVTSGLYHVNKLGLWPDENNMYWLDPTSATTTSWITSVVLELKDLGFNEVLLTDFRFPVSEKYIFNGDKDQALNNAAVKIQEAVSAADFTLSFCVDSPAFTLPDGRCRLYLEGVGPETVEARANNSGMEDPKVSMVFLTETGDTRYDNFSVLRSIMVSEEVEARKGGG